MAIRLAKAFIGAALVLIVTAQAAAADCHVDGDDIGSGYEDVGSGSQFMSWNKLTRKIQVYSQAFSGMSTSVCLDAIVDWMTTSGHYDNRTARNCDPGSNLSPSHTDPSDWAGRTVTGMQKASGCRYEQNPPTYDPCEYLPPSEPGCLNGAAHVWDDLGHLVHLRRQNGTKEFNDGGDPANNEG